MFTKSGKATVTYDNQLIPIAYDGECAGTSISAPTIEAALKEFEWKPGYLGFKFAEAVSGRVVLDNNEEITFRNTKAQPTTYLFAQTVFNPEEFAKAASAPSDEKFKNAYDQMKSMRPDVLEDSSSVIYEGARGVRSLDKWDQKNTVLINRQGTQIWPTKGP